MVILNIDSTHLMKILENLNMERYFLMIKWTNDYVHH